MKTTIFTILVLLALTLLLAGCSTSAKDIKENPGDYVGKDVSLRGTSKDSIKLGKLSGFTLEQDDGSTIAISSEDLPKDGSKVTVRGTVMKDSLFGVYVLAKSIN